MLPAWIKTSSAILLILLILRAFLLKFFMNKKIIIQDENMENIFKIPDMNCKHCVMSIQNEIKKVSGVKKIDISLSDKLVNVIGEYNRNEVIIAIRNAGYSIKKINYWQNRMNLKILHKISYGLYIISSKKDSKINGQIANTVFQITSEPPTIAVSINKQNLTHEFIQESKIFTISIISQNTQMKLIGNFGFKSGRDFDKFSDVIYKISKKGVPIIMEIVLVI